MSNPVPADQRQRRACEPCRRKKCRCTGERPVCSFCQHLNIRCVYLPRGHATEPNANRISKTPSPQDGRFRRLEHQVTEIYSMLNSISNQTASSTTLQPVEPHGTPSTQLPLSSIRHGSPHRHAKQSRMSSEVLDQLVTVYRAKLHLQPLPLFHPRTLREVLASSSPYFVQSFVALVSPFSCPESPGHVDAETLRICAASAETTVMKMAADGISKLDIVQSLCLLALKDVLEKKPNRAWMSIGTASRLEALRQLKRRSVGSQIGDEDENSRCFWSVFILERVLGPPDLRPVDLEFAPEYPPSFPTPAAVSHHGRDTDYESAGDVPRDLGVNAYYIQMLLVWGRVASYLRSIRAGKLERPWSADSTYTKLNIEVLEFEAQLPPAQLLRNRTLAGRLHVEVADEQEYWDPWLIMQILSHACPALINHPFLHLVVMRSREAMQQSRMFLQQVVDQSLFHSGWVLRFLALSELLPFESNDPFLGHLVAAIATVPWIFQFARDPSVSVKAREDVAKCVVFLERISSRWPHLSRKLEVLQSLQATANCQLWDAESRNTTVTFHSSKIWELFEINLADTFGGSHIESGSVSNDEIAPDVSMRVTTQHVQPLDEQEYQTSASSIVVDAGMTNPAPFENIPTDDSLFLLSPEDFWVAANF